MRVRFIYDAGYCSSSPCYWKSSVYRWEFKQMSNICVHWRKQKQNAEESDFYSRKTFIFPEHLQESERNEHYIFLSTPLQSSNHIERL